MSSAAASAPPPLMARLRPRQLAPSAASAPRPRSRSRSRSRSRPITSVFEERPSSSSPVPEGCICHRAHSMVLCKNCGWFHKEGRIRMPCPVHLRTMYLLDIELCPQCRAYPPILTEIN